MGKKCIICGKEAIYSIKGTNDFYCEECAKENFDDISVLITVEQQAQALKKVLNESFEEE